MTRLRTVRLFAILLFTLLPISRAAFAEPDTLFTGTGRDGSLTLTSGPQLVNGYAALAAPVASGATSVRVGRLPNGPLIAAGDLVMILQTQGLTPAPESGNQQTVDLRASSVGTWEFARVASRTTTVYSNDTLVLTAPLVHSFSANAQVLRVPEYTDVTLDGGSITAANFRGGSGGVIAMVVQGTLTLKNGGAIRADGTGFESGFAVNDSSGSVGCLANDVLAPSGAGKGEGVGPAYDQSQTGRGNMGNGAGGGDCYLAGGGGGGNAGAGGNGGASDPSDGERLAGGMGGASILASPLDHLVPGGGGGAGHSAHSTGGSGGNGGGIVFIRAGAIAGNGIISANGAPGAASSLDAAGGGGAGGTIHIRSASTIDCGIALSAIGGDGGAVAIDGPGTGGGGGGGFVYVQAQSTTCANPALGGGIFGRNNVASSRYATAGTGGTVVKTSGAMQQPVPPSISNLAAGAVIATAHPSFSGYGTPSSTVRGYLDGVWFADTFTFDGFWSLNAPSIALADGAHTIGVTTILEGLESAATTRTFTVDTTPPAAPAITSPVAATTVNAHGTIGGTTEPNAHVRVTLDGTSFDATADSAGAFALAPFAMSNGSHTISAYATDVAGNDGPASTPFSFTVDAIPPATPSASLAGTSPTNSLHPAFTGSSEAGSTISLKLGAVTETFAGGASWTHTLSATLGEGSYTADVVAIDGVGNESPAAHVAFTVDLTGPAAPQLTKPLANAPANGIEGTAEAGATVFVTIDGVETGFTIANGPGGSWVLSPSSIGDGVHTVSARARDAAGNFGASSATISFTLDRVGPAAPVITSPANGTQTTSRTVTVSGTAEPNASIELVASATLSARTTTTAAQNGSWSATIDVPSDDTFAITAQATDVAGNAGAVSSAITVRVESRVNLTVTSPATAVYGQPVTITATGTYILNGQPMQEGSVTFFRDGIAFLVANVANGSATATNVLLTPGAHTLNATHSSLGTACCGSPNVSIVINPAFTRIALHRSGDAISASVTAVAPSVAIPDGNVVFTIDGATYTAQLIGGVATIQPARNGGAAHQLAAAYSGTAAFYASSVASVVAPLPAPAPPTRRRAAGS